MSSAKENIPYVFLSSLIIISFSSLNTSSLIKYDHENEWIIHCVLLHSVKIPYYCLIASSWLS